MSKQKAIRIDHFADVPLDLPGTFLRIERRYWADGTSCLHIAKWGPIVHKKGRFAGRVIITAWNPPQYTQVPWQFVWVLIKAMIKAALSGVGQRARGAA